MWESLRLLSSFFALLLFLYSPPLLSNGAPLCSIRCLHHLGDARSSLSSLLAPCSLLISFPLLVYALGVVFYASSLGIAIVYKHVRTHTNPHHTQAHTHTLAYIKIYNYTTANPRHTQAHTHTPTYILRPTTTHSLKITSMMRLIESPRAP